MAKKVVFTDLDGTLLEIGTYSFEAAKPALQLLKEKGILLVLCTSKTRREVEMWQKRLGVSGPFITENGGGIFLPLSFPRPEGFKPLNGYWTLALGTPYASIRRAILELRQKGFHIRGFGDMEAKEIARITGMTLDEASLAKEREFSEPCLYEGELNTLKEALVERGLTFWKGGRFLHVQGHHNKGQAMAILEDFFKVQMGEIETIALGDGLIDMPMLERANRPVIVRRKGGLSERINPPERFFLTEKEGPAGWAEAIMSIFKGEL